MIENAVNSIVNVQSGKVLTSSLIVAEAFGKRHSDVLRKIERALEAESTRETTQRNFTFSTYEDSTGRKLPCYLLTRDAFSFLTMGFTGEKADQWKWNFLEAFNAMERAIMEERKPLQHVPSSTDPFLAMLEGVKTIYIQQQEMGKALQDQNQRLAAIEQERALSKEAVLSLPAPDAPEATNQEQCLVAFRELQIACGMDFQELWRSIYTEFEARAHVRISAHVGAKESKLGWICKSGRGHILYKIMCERIDRVRAAAI